MRVCIYAQETHAFNSRMHMHTNIREHKCVSNFARDRRSLAECRLFSTSQRFSRAARRQLDQNRVATTDEKSCYHLKMNNDAGVSSLSPIREALAFLGGTVTHLGLHVTVVVAVSRTAHQRVAGFLARSPRATGILVTAGATGNLASLASGSRKTIPGFSVSGQVDLMVRKSAYENLHLSSTWKLPISQS